MQGTWSKDGNVFYPHDSMKIETLRSPETAMDDETLFDVWKDAATELSRNRCENVDAASGSREVEAALRKALLNRLSMYGTVIVSSDKPLPPVTRRPG